MAAVTIRNLPDEVHRALKARARANGRSTEAEIREILRETVMSATADSLVDRIADIKRRHGSFELDVERDQSPPEAADFT